MCNSGSYTWILSIVHHRGVDQLRSIASRHRTQGSAEAAAPTSQPSEAFAETWCNSQRAQVREALRALPPEQLKVLELAYFSGYTHTEIAKLLDLPQVLARSVTYEKEPRGTLGLVADREERVLVGAWAVAPLAGEWIHQACWAVRTRTPIATLLDGVFQFPTFSQGYLAALEQLDL